MKLSVELSALTDKFGDYKAAELAKEAGFDAVDYSYYWDNEKEEVLGDNYREYAERLRAHFDKIGIECNQAHAPFSFSYSHAMDVSDERYLWILHSIESAVILGAKNIIIHAVSVPDGVDLEEYNIGYYKSFIPYCEKFGINVSVENLFTHAPNGCLIGMLGSPEELNRIVEKINSPWVNACVDIGHAALTGYKPEDFIHNMNPSIFKAVHIHDNDFIADRHTLPFTGEFRWEEIITALSIVGYGGDLTFEIFHYLHKIPYELIPDALKFAVSVGRYIISKLEYN